MISRGFPLFADVWLFLEWDWQTFLVGVVLADVPDFGRVGGPRGGWEFQLSLGPLNLILTRHA